MLKSHERFHSANGKRLILVADDEFINRELMRTVLQDDYELAFAENGQEALEVMKSRKDELSLVLLDLMMPVLSGIEVLKRAKADRDIAQIPIIVITSDQEAEVESLTIGAIDFIPKPYPQAGVILARVLRTIELSEDRDIIQSTERDELTDLYNREYFYRYAEQFDQHHKDMQMDAIVVDVNHFHMINERFGTAYGDKVLKGIGESLRATVIEVGGIVCRREADTFMVYCPHGVDHEVLLENASMVLMDEDAGDGRIWLRLGVYANVDKQLDIERRFDRAKMAADTVQGSFTRRVGVYDSALHEKELYTEQIVQDFPTAVKERQFQIYYQPKFDVQYDTPALASAEALVRWEHPDFGMISPGVFVPLFEENGLIQQLDVFVWRQAAEQLRAWKERFGFAVPVSVNVSRIDMYDPHLVDTFVQILDEYGLTTDELLLEITESAYTQDSDQIIATVNELRKLGFKVEMDDFGTGYSSLNMISTLPIDALKLDMQFTRNAFGERHDTRMLEVIIDIANYLSVPVIAEGVETAEQLKALKEMGCDYVQGYYFSKPISADEYERFIVERGQLLDEVPLKRERAPRVDLRHDESAFGEIAHVLTNELEAARSSIVTYASIARALAADYFSIYYVNSQTDDFVEYSAHAKFKELGLETSGDDFFNLSRDNIKKVIHPDDVDMFLSAFTKQQVMAELENDKAFTLTYRLMFGDVATYVHLKATKMEDRDDPHIVIGVSNIDDQMRREQEYTRALRMATQDALTGVKSKYAYEGEERAINAAIAEGAQAPFALAVCGLDDLKRVNDTLGHVAGDRYIKDACRAVCLVFKHSPVYRVGGDEFVAILRGGDYDIRDELMGRLGECSQASDDAGGLSIAGGLAVYAPGEDACLADVFGRADAAMDKNRKKSKDIEGTE